MAVTKMDKLMENLSNGFANFYRTAYGKNPPDVDHVIFNGPATIVFWEDGKKTVVKRKMDDPDNKNLAIMYAIMKRYRIRDIPEMIGEVLLWAIGILAALLGILIYGLLFDPSMFVHHVVVTAK